MMNLPSSKAYSVIHLKLPTVASSGSNLQTYPFCPHFSWLTQLVCDHFGYPPFFQILLLLSPSVRVQCKDTEPLLHVSPRKHSAPPNPVYCQCLRLIHCQSSGQDQGLWTKIYRLIPPPPQVAYYRTRLAADIWIGK